MAQNQNPPQPDRDVSFHGNSFFLPSTHVFSSFSPDPSAANSNHFIPTDPEPERHDISSENHIQSLFSTGNEADSKLAQDSQELLRLLLNHLAPVTGNVKDEICKEVEVPLEKIRTESSKQINVRKEMSMEIDHLKDEIKRLNNVVTELKKNFQNLGHAIWVQVTTNLER